MRSLVIAPHPDDETLGVGGTIIKRKKNKSKVGLILVTEIKKNKKNFVSKSIKEKEIDQIKKKYNFDYFKRLNYPTTKLNSKNLKQLIDRFSKIFREFKPEEVFLPHADDTHSDHQIIFQAISACTKKFRFPFVKKILSYETLSETGYGIKPRKIRNNFYPNYYIDISPFFEKKIKILKIYKSEIKKHPFPRSSKSITSLAILRGAESNCKYAEAFEVLKIYE